MVEHSNEVSDEEDLKVACENCGKSFSESSLTRHIARPSNLQCKKFYGPRLDELKRKNDRKRCKKYYSNVHTFTFLYMCLI